MLKELDIVEYKSILLEIMDSVDAYCRQNGISYFIEGGTLIGAVRHHGFIPWDDDIDIVMPRQHYERFVNNFKDENNRFKVVSIENEKKYYLSYAKVIDTTTIVEEEYETKFELGAYIDIFPLDWFDSVNQVIKANKNIKFYRDLLWAKNVRLSSQRKLYKNLLILLMKFFGCVFSREKLITIINFKAQSYSSSNAMVLAPMVSMIYGVKSIFPFSVFEQQIEMSFEGHSYLAPIGYDDYLTTVYGDYMKLPPIEKQVSHHKFKAWKKVD